MKSIRLKRWVAAAGLAAACALLAAPPASAIIGGAPATSNFPWIAYVYHDGSVCTGELVTPTQVLTAAHCATVGGGIDKTPEPAASYELTLGANDVGAAGADNYKVAKITVDPQWDPQTNPLGGDLALLTLDRRASEQPLPVIFDQESDLEKPGTEATILGYGQTENEGATTHILHEARIPIQPSATCLTDDDGSSPLIELCAGRETGGVGVCHGDSGGPLLVPGYNGQYVLVAVAAHLGGDDCAAKGDYSFYSRLQGVAQGAWLDSQIGSHAGPVPGQTGPTPVVTPSPTVQSSPSVQPNRTAVVPSKDGKLAFRFTNPTGSVFTGTATLTAKTGSLGNGVKLTLSAKHATVVSIRLSRSALTRLKRKRSLTAVLTAPISASDGKALTLRETVIVTPRT